LSEVDRVQLKKSSPETVAVKKWVEFWRWQSKLIAKVRLLVRFEVAVRALKIRCEDTISED
jgi:hypothetical protein